MDHYNGSLMATARFPVVFKYPNLNKTDLKQIWPKTNLTKQPMKIQHEKWEKINFNRGRKY